MGEVYRARDTKLNRDVALKILPEAFTNDPDRLARFRREAQVLASLNHPNIAGIYGFEDSGGTHALVMELVEGEDLSAVIARGSIALPDALPIARQIADALEAAHEQGIIHRDLKPANVKVRADGTVKVLDFGLAKAVGAGDGPAEAGRHDLANSPTLTARATEMGMILGTAAYMAPEQARGKPVDKRADIWAFGVVLYEMLTGRRAFEGDDISITLANVLKDDVKWEALPADLPVPLQRLLRRCLDKDPKKRLRDIGEARVLLGDPIDTAPASLPAPAERQRTMRALVIGLALTAAVLAAVAGYVALRPPPAPALVRLDLAPPPGHSTAYSHALSPDGRVVAFVAGAGAKSAIWLRPLAAGTAYPIGGTEGGLGPFWSADGTQIGFFTGARGEGVQVKKVPASGGKVQVVGEVPFALRGTWSRDGVILVSQSGGGGAEGVLFRLPAAGGAAKPASNISSSRWPFFLPDGRHFLFTVVNQDPTIAGIYVGALDSNDRTRLTDVISGAQYAGGYLFYVKDQTVVGQPFDARTQKLTGEPVPVFENVTFAAPIYVGGFAVTDTAIVAQARPDEPPRQLTWMDRAGTATGTLSDPGDFTGPDLSPDGRLLAFTGSTVSGGQSALWMLDIERNVLTQARSQALSVRFSTDGTQIAFSTREGVMVAAAGGGRARMLAGPDTTDQRRLPLGDPVVGDWSPDDRQVSAMFGPLSQLYDVGNGAPAINVGRGGALVFSPAGNWVAYTAGMRGQGPVAVAPFGKPFTGAGWIQVSAAAARLPRWRRDGRELFYISSANELMATPVTPGPTLTLGVSKRLFTLPTGASYDVSADGQRFIVALPVGDVSRPPVSVLLNWRALLPR